MKKIIVLAKTKSKIEGVEQLHHDIFSVKVRAPPVNNQANVRIIELLSEFLKIPKRDIILHQGHHSKKKIFYLSKE